MAYPVRPVTYPSVLNGQNNGRLATSILTTTAGLAGGPDVRLVAPAARAWRALTAAASVAGHTLKATSLYDSYRPYSVQEAIFVQRYQLDPIPGQPWKLWNGVRWYQKQNVATAAVPGTSNHGWALAVDTGEEKDGDSGTESLDQNTLNWLVTHELLYGFSHELQSEPWHIRYYTGDHIPAAVLAFEEDTVDADQFLDIMNDEKVAALWKARTVQYAFEPNMSLLAMYHDLYDTVKEIRALMTGEGGGSGDPAIIRAIVREELDKTKLTG